MDRIAFYTGITGNNDPHVFVRYFDQFVALYKTVSEFDNINAVGPLSNDPANNLGFRFNVNFKSETSKDRVMSSMNTNIMVYQKPININVESLTDISVNLIIK